jgi:hypothetical protein
MAARHNNTCKAKNCNRLVFPNNYGFCEVHRKYVSRAERRFNKINGIAGRDMSTGNIGHLEAEGINRLIAAVPVGEMPSSRLLEKLANDPVISQNRNKTQILEYYMFRIKQKINKRIKASISTILQYDILDEKYRNDEINELLKDPFIAKHCTETYIRKYFNKFNVFTSKEVVEQSDSTAKASNHNQRVNRNTNVTMMKNNETINKRTKPSEQHLRQVQHLLSLCVNGHDLEGGSNCVSTYFRMLSSELANVKKRGKKVILPYNIVKAAFEIAYNNGDRNVIVQFLRTVLENSDDKSCFYHSHIQIELLFFLYSFDLEQALSSVSYTHTHTLSLSVSVCLPFACIAVVLACATNTHTRIYLLIRRENF